MDGDRDGAILFDPNRKVVPVIVSGMGYARDGHDFIRHRGGASQVSEIGGCSHGRVRRGGIANRTGFEGAVESTAHRVGAAPF